MALKEVKPCSKREQKGSRNWTNLAKYGWSRDAGLFLLPELGTVVIYSLPKASVLAGTGTQGMAGTGRALGSHLPLHCSTGQEQVPVIAQRLMLGSATCLHICSGS